MATVCVAVCPAIPIHHFEDVRVGELITNCWLSRSYVAVVSSPRSCELSFDQFLLSSTFHSFDDSPVAKFGHGKAADDVEIIAKLFPLLELLGSSLS